MNTLRVWIVGLFCIALGGFGAYASAKDGAWIFAVGCVALLLVSVHYIARPGQRSLGAVEFVWGVLILSHAYRTGQAMTTQTAREAGQSGAILLGGVLVLAGLFHVLRPSAPQTKAKG